MCRILLVRGERAFDPGPHLAALAAIARDSREYQGHGWGVAWRDGGGWKLYHDIRPVWEDPAHAEPGRFPATDTLIVHARSAFRDEGIVVENNMPFADGERVFAFNGELRGVRIKEAGRIGAEKIFNYVKRFNRGDLAAALSRGCEVIRKRTRYVRAMNVILADSRMAAVACHFGEDPDYFQLRRTRRDGRDIVCSDPYPGESGCGVVGNGETLTFPLVGGEEDSPRRHEGHEGEKRMKTTEAQRTQRRGR